MGVDMIIYCSRIVSVINRNGSDISTGKIFTNFSNAIEAIGALSFIRILLVISGIEQNPGPNKTENSDIFTALVALIVGICFSYIKGFDISWTFYLSLPFVIVTSFLILQSKPRNEYLKILVLFTAIVAITVGICTSMRKIHEFLLTWKLYFPFVIAICYLILDSKPWNNYFKHDNENEVEGRSIQDEDSVEVSSQPKIEATRITHCPPKQAYLLSKREEATITTTTTEFSENIKKNELSNIMADVESQDDRNELSNTMADVESQDDRSELSNTMDDVESQDYRNELGNTMDDVESQDDRSELANTMDEIEAQDYSEWSPHEMEIFQHPMCLISAKSDTNELDEETTIVLKMEEKTIKQIQQIKWPMVVVAVVGLYRTGKSYLMNRLADSSKGFVLGDAIESTTKGIWSWCKIHPERSNTVLMLLDTEGLGDVEKGDLSHDNKIFTLATLLCNCLVYNMKGAFDNDAIAKITYVTEVAKNIRFRGEASEDNKSLNLILPDFVLCLRDFSLKLKKADRKLSENDYLEESLAENKKRNSHFNKPRECIRKYFAKRECFAFPVPGDSDVLENMDTLSFSDLSDKFKEATTRFVSYIYSKPPKELLASKPVNGQMFVILVDRYVTAIIHGAVPDVDDAFTAVARAENAKITKEAIARFKNQMKNITLPVPKNDLRRVFTKAQEAALNYLRKNVVHDKNSQQEEQAMVKMNTIWTEVEKDNDEKVRKLCESNLHEAYKNYFEGKIENKEYEVAGGYKNFQRDFERLNKEYTSELRDFDESEILWTWHGFVKRMKDFELKIVEADENLSLKEKEEEQRRNQENIDKLLKEHQKTQEEVLEKQKQYMESHIKKLEDDRNEQMKIEREKYEALANEKLDEEEAKEEVNRYRKEEQERKRKWIGGRLWNAIMNN